MTAPEALMQPIPGLDEIITINPSTGEELGRMPALGRGGIDAALERGRQAQTAWAQQPLSARVQPVRVLMEAILAERMAIAELIALEQGKPVAEALAAEIFATLAILKDLVRTGP
ncbi:MAG TPA: aldehyde dehydrogenase family protein, partial [bacterium]|nr:aldehyde dehydrogenase family protein [bacterium]